MTQKIIIKGAKEHNLKNIDIEIPRNKLVIITGLSGSGKSSLAFDTLYAEGQRRYVESLSAYARQFLEKMHKPDIEYIEGLSPAISIEQRTGSSTPRSTVGTTTEIFDYLRLLFARIGIAHCYQCGKRIFRQTPQEIVDQIFALPENAKISIMASLVRGRKGEYAQILKAVKQKGYVRVRIDGKIRDLSEEISLSKYKKHTLEVVVDRLSLRENNRKRITESVETSLKVGEGIVIVACREPFFEDKLFSELNACLDCGLSYGELSPRMFSFNSPYGACTACHGLGTRMNVDAELVINKKKSLNEGAIIPWVTVDIPLLNYNRRILKALAERYKFSLDDSFYSLDKKIQKIILHGSKGDKLKLVTWKEGKPYYLEEEFEGVIKNIERRYTETTSSFIKEELAFFMTEMICPDCQGSRLKPESLAVTLGNKSIFEVTQFSIKKANAFFNQLKLSKYEYKIGKDAIKEIQARLKFMMDVGLGYLTLDRKSSTLAGGEAQRIRLATQIGSKLVGVLYVLDEPSIGLHPRDNIRLLNTLEKLRDLGNSVIVVEHDEATIRKGDFIIDLGPGAGNDGGYVVESGSVERILSNEKSLTGHYLNRKLKVSIPKTKLKRKIKYLEVKGAGENNLKNINVKIPLGLLVCVTGVSGSGKSTLVDDILRKALQKRFYNSKDRPGKHKTIKGLQHIDKVTTINQKPIGRTPRSNPATYTGLFSLIRDLYATLPEAKVRGYSVGRFSFNVKGGRCEACQGDGIIRIDMHFLPTVYIECEVCKGKRFNRETLEINFKDKNISDILDSTVNEALKFFKHLPKIKDKLQILYDVGLGYIKLGQSATTLSGGEAQRIKLAAELSKKSTGKTLYILDEPTTGLHFADISKLLEVLRRLVDAKNTVLVVEHNLDVIKSADYIIDLGPEGGDEGGEVVVAGYPEEVMESEESYTGKYLKEHLSKF